MSGAIATPEVISLPPASPSPTSAGSRPTGTDSVGSPPGSGADPPDSGPPDGFAAVLDDQVARTAPAEGPKHREASAADVAAAAAAAAGTTALAADPTPAAGGRPAASGPGDVSPGSVSGALSTRVTASTAASASQGAAGSVAGAVASGGDPASPSDASAATSATAGAAGAAGPMAAPTASVAATAATVSTAVPTPATAAATTTASVSAPAVAGPSTEGITPTPGSASTTPSGGTDPTAATAAPAGAPAPSTAPLPSHLIAGHTAAAAGASPTTPAAERPGALHPATPAHSGSDAGTGHGSTGSDPRDPATAPRPAVRADGGDPASATTTGVGATPTASSTPATGATARPEVPTAYGVRLAQAADEVAGSITLAARNGATQARIQLAPESLGGIQIHLQHTEDGLVARVIADHPEAARALAAHGDELRESLTARGSQLLRLDISTAGDPRGSAAGRDAATGDGSAAGARVGRDEDPDGAGDATTLLSTLSITTRGTSALVDVLA